MNAKRETNLFKWTMILMFGAIVLFLSWNSDEAFHSYIMAKNLAEGNGFVYNVGYRVSVADSPLYTLMTALVYLLLGRNHMYFTGIILGTVFSAAAIYIMVFKICKSLRTACMTVILLVCCYAFMCYTTSGLENSLLYFLSALFIWLFSSRDEFDSRGLFYLTFLISLLALTRMSAVLLFLPAVLFGYLFLTNIRLTRRVLVGLAGLFPFIVWEFFSLIYYGYPISNVAYNKLNSGLPLRDFVMRGLDYIYRSSTIDMIIIIIPIVTIAIAAARRQYRSLSLSIGTALYILFVIVNGGSVMVGRYLATPFFCSLLTLIIMFKDESDFIIGRLNFRQLLEMMLVLELIGAVIIRPIGRESLFHITQDESITGVSDEKEWYYKYTGLFPYVQTQKYSGGSIDLFVTTDVSFYYYLENIKQGYKGNVQSPFILSGITNYYIQEEGVYYGTDAYGNMDPLLSHLHAVDENNWRTGYMKRWIPEGYEESVNTGTNLIKDPFLHEFYDHVLTIVSGDICSVNRLRTIVGMNTGKYNYLIEEYLKNNQSN